MMNNNSLNPRSYEQANRMKKIHPVIEIAAGAPILEGRFLEDKDASDAEKKGGIA